MVWAYFDSTINIFPENSNRMLKYCLQIQAFKNFDLFEQILILITISRFSEAFYFIQSLIKPLFTFDSMAAVNRAWKEQKLVNFFRFKVKQLNNRSVQRTESVPSIEVIKNKYSRDKLSERRGGGLKEDGTVYF